MKICINIFLFFIVLSFSRISLAIPNSFADLVEKLSPAVVSIASTTILPDKNPQDQVPQFPEGSPFDEFFKDYFDRDQRRSPSQRPITGLGSGFIIDSSGIIVTNNHVIEGASEITVILSDQKEFSAELLGRDPKADIAVLKIDPKNIELTSVNWGDSDKIRVGDWTIAIGNPLNLGGTVTAGILSAIARDIGSGPYVKFLQTDASINRGNSGGPLFDVDGLVIGINTAIISQTGGSIGLGFAIPSNSAKKIVQQLIEFGRTKRGWLGVQIQPVSKDFAESLGLSNQKGAFVSNVNPQGPSKEAGIESGDVILKFNDIEITKMSDLPRVVAESDVGSIAKVELWRKNKIESLGITIKDTDNNKGVIVVKIDDQNSNLLVGDIITEINREKVSNLNSFEKLINKIIKTGRASVLFKVSRDNESIWLSYKFINN